MKKLTKVVFGLSGSAPVSVINVPLPVQGTVSVGNTPNVHVTNTPVVTVGNLSVGLTRPSSFHSARDRV